MGYWDVVENLRHCQKWVTGDMPLKAEHCLAPTATCWSSQAQQLPSTISFPHNALRHPRPKSNWAIEENHRNHKTENSFSPLSCSAWVFCRSHEKLTHPAAGLCNAVQPLSRT